MRGQERGKFFASQVRIGDKRGRRKRGGREGREKYLLMVDGSQGQHGPTTY
jgi:hypothetical protein